MLKFNWLVLAMLTVSALTTVGCATICDKIEAAVPATNARLADAHRAMQQVEDSGVREMLTGDALEAFDHAMANMAAGYELAVQSTALASEACADPSNYLRMIVDAWTIIRPFLGRSGGAESGSPMVADPILWIEAQ